MCIYIYMHVCLYISMYALREYMCLHTYIYIYTCERAAVSGPPTTSIVSEEGTPGFTKEPSLFNVAGAPGCAESLSVLMLRTH